ncbi:hypothetical protein [Prevotella dentasini]|uniref:hypothetical protein n=1 Tax=Prevotella dentasini TaxID=589537 RepID=UPI000AD23E08|nr:hypothetical protein [Prevotella dentasini]
MSSQEIAQQLTRVVSRLSGHESAGGFSHGRSGGRLLPSAAEEEATAGFPHAVSSPAYHELSSASLHTTNISDPRQRGASAPSPRPSAGGRVFVQQNDRTIIQTR